MKLFLFYSNASEKNNKNEDYITTITKKKKKNLSVSGLFVWLHLSLKKKEMKTISDFLKGEK